MHPRTIQRYEAGPNFAPMMAPKIGPVPAMFRNWIMNTFQVGIGMKSTPSALLTAGVGRSGSGPKTLSTNAPYSPYPATSARIHSRNETITIYFAFSTRIYDFFVILRIPSCHSERSEGIYSPHFRFERPFLKMRQRLFGF